MQREVGNSLSLPRLTRKTVSRNERKREALGEFSLDKDRRTLIALVSVLLVDGCVMLLWVVAAFQDNR